MFEQIKQDIRNLKKEKRERIISYLEPAFKESERKLKEIAELKQVINTKHIRIVGLEAENETLKQMISVLLDRLQEVELPDETTEWDR